MFIKDESEGGLLGELALVDRSRQLSILQSPPLRLLERCMLLPRLQHGVSPHKYGVRTVTPAEHSPLPATCSQLGSPSLPRLV